MGYYGLIFTELLFFIFFLVHIINIMGSRVIVSFWNEKEEEEEDDLERIHFQRFQ